MRAYQEYLHDLYSSASNRSCLTSKCYKVRSLRIIVYSGIYDGITIAYCDILQSLLKEDGIFMFKCVTAYGTHRTFYSKSPKSLLALVRKHLKEEV